MSTELTVVEPQKQTFLMPVGDVRGALERRQIIAAFVKNVMVEGTDYGVVPGTRGKPTLFKPGAENLCAFFGLVPYPTTLKEVYDLTGGEQSDGKPLILFGLRVDLLRSGVVVGSGVGLCSNRERKYVNVPVGDVANTVFKMAFKRAFVAAALVATGASAFFTQDLEDFVDAAPVEVAPAVKPAPVEDKRALLAQMHALGAAWKGSPDAWKATGPTFLARQIGTSRTTDLSVDQIRIVIDALSAEIDKAAAEPEVHE